MRFPEAVLRGALGYFWHDEGMRFAPLYDLFFGVTEQAERDKIATPPVGAVLSCTHGEGELFELNVVLFGKHEKLIPLLFESLVVLGREGVGEKYVRFYVEGFPSFGTSSITEWILKDPVDGQMLPLSFCPSHGVFLDITQPMTLRAIGGKFLMEWDTDAFFRNLIQRLKLLSKFYGSPLPDDWGSIALENLKQVSASSDTHLVERVRRSSRQKSRLDYSGFMGTVVLRNVSADLFDLLRMGCQVRVGKNTIMGSGSYTISFL